MPDLDCDQTSILEIMVQGGDCSPPPITSRTSVRCGGDAGETGSGSSEEKKGKRDRGWEAETLSAVAAESLAGMAA